MADPSGFPRLPYDKFWPDQNEIDIVLKRAQANDSDPHDALESVLSLIYPYVMLHARNDAWQARTWGVADESEHTAEQWNYLRNADFTQGALGDYKWAHASVTAVTGTTGLPYGLRKAVQGTNTNVASERFFAQSVSAQGNAWYCYSGWVRPAAGAYAGIAVVENSGSTSARTHAQSYPLDTATAWRRIPDHIAVEKPFKTYKGTTRLAFRCTIAGNGIAQFARMQLELGKRPHPWRPNVADRGNWITSLKTAAGASDYGNIRMSASGPGAVREAGKTFVFGTKLGTATPAGVSTSGTVGTAATLARSDHRHRGVRSIRTAGSASFAGSIVVSSSGTGSIRQVAGPPRKFVFPIPPAATAAPVNPSTSATVGASGRYARQDARVRAVRSIRRTGGASFSGSIVFSASTNAAIRQVAGPPRKFVIGATGGGAEKAANAALRWLSFG